MGKTLKLSKTLTLTGGQFSWWAILWLQVTTSCKHNITAQLCDIYNYVSSEQKICFRDFEHLRQEKRSCLLNYCKLIVYFTPSRSIENNPLTSSSKCVMSIILKLFS